MCSVRSFCEQDIEIHEDKAAALRHIPALHLLTSCGLKKSRAMVLPALRKPNTQKPRLKQEVNLVVIDPSIAPQDHTVKKVNKE